MSLERGKFGIEYDPKRAERDRSGFGWVFVVVALAVFVTFGWTLVRRISASREEAALVELDPQEAKESVEVFAPRAEIEPPDGQTSRVFQSFQPLNADLSRRPPKVRNLLMRLEEAEKRHDVEMAVTTIETIRALPGTPAADMDDSLARRLGALNVQSLFNLHNAQWVKTVMVGRGDSPSRIAAENGSTLASFVRLNGGRIDRIVVGQKLYVMNHPRFNLVIHRRTKTADLSLNGKFFKRYDLQSVVNAREGAYEMPESRRLFWAGIGSCFDEEGRAELDVLLPKATPILVAEM